MTSRVAMVCLSALGGSGTVAVELAHALEQRGTRVTVLAERAPARLRAGTSFVEVDPIEHPAFGSPYALALASTLLRRFRERPFDLVHLHYAVPHAATAVVLRQALREREPAIVITLHGSDVTSVARDEAHAAILSGCLRAADALTVPSAFLRAAARRGLGVSPAVVPNFVDTDIFRPERRDRARVDALFGSRPSELTLVHVSNFRPVKATRSLLPALAEIRGRITGARMVLIGEGPERAQVEADARAAGLIEAVRFVDPPALDGLASLLASGDVFVLPSELESFGLAALEALASGTPVVARKVGGLPEVIRDRVTGRLVERPEEIASAILELAGAPLETRRTMSTAAADDARRRFSPAIAVDAYGAVYRRAIDRAAQRARVAEVG